MASSQFSSLLDLGFDAAAPGELRQQAVWILGHHDDERIRPRLRQLADNEYESLPLRRVAAYGWYRLNPPAAFAETSGSTLAWPADLLLPILTATIDETVSDAWRRWVRGLAARRPDIAPAAFMMLGDEPTELVPTAILGTEELSALGLPDPKTLDGKAALAAGQEWAMHPPGDAFGRQAAMDAYHWADRTLKMRVAWARYESVRRWETWLEPALGMPAEPPLPSPAYTPIALPSPQSAVEATALLILGALAQHLAHEPAMTQVVSGRLSAEAAALHFKTSETYQNAAISAWHVASFTGLLRTQLLSQVQPPD